MREHFATYEKLAGLNNAVSSPRDLAVNELQQADDVDIDLKGRISRKAAGTVQVLAGDYKNLFSNGRIMMGTIAGNLVQLDINSDGNFYSVGVLRSGVGDYDMSYADIAGTGIIYYSNGSVIGYIKNFQSYIMASTTVRDTVDTFPMYPIEYFGNRLWGFVGDVLWKTDPDQLLYFNRINPEQGFYQRKGAGTLLKAVHDGLYFADGSHWFLKNAGRKEENTEFICDYDAIPGTATQEVVDMEILAPGGQSASGKGHIWATERGIRAGLSGGTSWNLTRMRLKMPSAIKGASLHRGDNDLLNQYIVVVKN